MADWPPSQNIRPFFVHFDYAHTFNLLKNFKTIVNLLLEWLNRRHDPAGYILNAMLAQMDVRKGLAVAHHAS